MLAGIYQKPYVLQCVADIQTDVPGSGFPRLRIWFEAKAGVGSQDAPKSNEKQWFP